MKVRVPVAGTVGKSVLIDPNGVTQEQLTAAIAAIPAAQAGVSGPQPTLWRLIREVPANIVKLAALTTAGLITRKSNGDILTRSVAVVDTARLVVTNADGGAGNPTLDMADISARSVWARSANSTGKPAPIQASGDKAVVRQSGTTVGFATIDHTFVSDFDTEADARIAAAVINALSDVTITSVADGDVLTYNTLAGVWKNAAPTGGGGSTVSVDTPPTSPNALDDEFTAGTLNVKWTVQNSPTLAASGVSGSYLAMVDTSNSADNIGVIEQTVAGNFKVRAKLASAAGAFDNRGGLMVRDHTSGNMYTFGTFFSGSAQWYVNKSTSFTGAGLANATIVANAQPNVSAQGRPWVYQEIEYDGTNLIFRASDTGVEGTFAQIYTVTTATFVATPDRIGVYSDRGTSTVTRFIGDWFRGGF